VSRIFIRRPQKLRVIEKTAAKLIVTLGETQRMVDSRFSNREGNAGNEHPHNVKIWLFFVKMFIVGLSMFVRIEGSRGAGIFDAFRSVAQMTANWGCR
jgi:hypothetical protein